ncbi:MAG: hypothetical protein Q4E24_16700 [bacterium]|nr:hypothetical protein [bacterium]
MNRKKLLIIICTVLLVSIVGLCVWLASCAVLSVGADTDFSVESLRWTIIGAIGSWVGSVFGAIALIVSLFALWLPQRLKIKVSVSTGFMLSQIPGIDKVDAYIITVKNVGMKPITVSNVYLHFGNKKRGDIFVGMLNQNSVLQAFTPTFPKRLEQGESFEYYLLRDKLNSALVHYEEKTPVDTPLSIRVDEVTKGRQYYKTKWTLRTFVRK